jgi:hypothetical protein
MEVMATECQGGSSVHHGNAGNLVIDLLSDEESGLEKRDCMDHEICGKNELVV